MSDILSKFSAHLKGVLAKALVLSVEFGAEHVGLLHLLLAIAVQKGSVAETLLAKSPFTEERIRGMMKLEIDRDPSGIPGLSEQVKVIIEKAVLTANVYKHLAVGTEHLLFALLELHADDLATLFDVNPNDLATFKGEIALSLKLETEFPDLQPVNAGLPNVEDLFSKQKEDSEESALGFFTKELTTKEAIKAFAPMIGRTEELRRLESILGRKTKNNPILIGEPGVGKTAIVEGLARLIVEGDAPSNLLSMHIHQLDLAGLVAGTMYRGEFESRLKQLIDEIEERDDIILFIDEVHMLAGAGGTGGSLDAANMLKPALARGELRCIGATTTAEYKKYIENDGALERRFQPIFVHEPSKEETRKLLTRVAKFYETHHNVRFETEALDAIVALCETTFASKRYPDKAIDLLDEAGSRKANESAKDAFTFEKKRYREVREALEKTREEKRQAVLKEHFELAGQRKIEEEALAKELATLKETTRGERKTITETDIVLTVAKMKRLNESDLRDASRLEKLERTLSSAIVGQPSAVTQVISLLKRLTLGLPAVNRPGLSLLFFGPSGVGKTRFAEALAEALAPQKESRLRIDLSQYKDPMSMTKLVGAPAGYVGYRDQGALTDHVKHHPEAVVLFDDLDRAHPEILHALGKLLTTGFLSDATGLSIDFRKTRLLFTTSATKKATEKTLGFGGDENEEARGHLEELLGARIIESMHGTIPLNRLNESDHLVIAKRELQKLLSFAKTRGLTLSHDSAILAHLAQSATKNAGVRGIKKRIEEEIETLIAEELLSESQKKKRALKLTVKNGKAVLARAK